MSGGDEILELSDFVNMLSYSINPPGDKLLDDRTNVTVRPSNCLVFGQKGVGKFTQLSKMLTERNISFVAIHGDDESSWAHFVPKNMEFQVLIVRRANALITGPNVSEDSVRFAIALSTMAKDFYATGLKCVISLYNVPPLILAHKHPSDHIVSEILRRFVYKAFVPAPVNTREGIFREYFDIGGALDKHVQNGGAQYVVQLNEEDYDQLRLASAYATPEIIWSWCKHVGTAAIHRYLSSQQKQEGKLENICIDRPFIESFLTHVGGHRDGQISLSFDDYREFEAPFAQTAGVILPKVMSKLEKTIHDKLLSDRDAQALEVAEKRIAEEDQQAELEALAAGRKLPVKRAKIVQSQGLQSEDPEKIWARLFEMENEGKDWKLFVWHGINVNDPNEYETRKIQYLANRASTVLPDPSVTDAPIVVTNGETLIDNITCLKPFTTPQE